MSSNEPFDPGGHADLRDHADPKDHADPGGHDDPRSATAPAGSRPPHLSPARARVVGGAVVLRPVAEPTPGEGSTPGDEPALGEAPTQGLGPTRGQGPRPPAARLASSPSAQTYPASNAATSNVPASNAAISKDRAPASGLGDALGGALRGLVSLMGLARGAGEAGGARPAAERMREGAREAEREQGQIVPAADVAGRALVFVIAIMTFLACLTQGTTAVLRGSAALWASEVSAEATIQIKPTETPDIDRSLETARAFALSVEGVSAARVLEPDEAGGLLEPWLGDLDLGELPVPRLVEIVVDTDAPPDFAAMREGLRVAVPGATLDDHRTWVDRLVGMARGAIAVGLALLALVLVATALTVVFATRGAMVGNRHVIEVLHFVGAEPRFVAREFEGHFLRVGAKGAAFGCAAAILAFLAGGWLAGDAGGAEGEIANAMFGRFSLGFWGYAGMIVIAGLVALITSATTGVTVRRTLDEMDEARGSGEKA